MVKYSFLLLFCLTVLPVDAANWQLVYSSNFNGELKPCGCSAEGNLGGVLRRATRLNEIRQHNENTVVVSAGDILGEVTEQSLIKARYMLQAIETYAMDAVLLGEQDLRYDHEILFRSRLPWVLTNQHELPVERFRERILDDGQRLVIFGILDPELAGAQLRPVVTDPVAAFDRALSDAKVSESDVVILLLHTASEDIRHFETRALVDIIVRGHIEKPVDQATLGGKVVSAGHRGQRLGIANYQDGTRLSNEVITLPSKIKDYEPLTRLYDDYNQEITRWYREKTRKMKTADSSESPYLSAESCQDCHPDAYRLWKTTRHANALQSLVKAGKDNDPECLVCHTVGFDRPGGYVAHSLTPQLANVQCDACHGAGKKHAEYPRVHRSGTASGQCLRCHTSENSPAFKFETYLPKILHPQPTPAPIQQQHISRVLGLYDVIDSDRPLVTAEQIEVIEFFNFYCNRCYVLNKNRQNLFGGLAKPVKHIEYPIIFGIEQKPWGSYAYLAAQQAGKAQAFKDAMFKAKFEDGKDIDDKETVIQLAAQLGLGGEARQAIDQEFPAVNRRYAQIQELKKNYKLYATPTLVINDNVRVLPEHTADNTNLLIENTREILLDMQCRQHAACDVE